MNQAFPWTQDEFNKRLKLAVACYWRGRKEQALEQRQRGKGDAGTRGEVTGGQHLNAFGDLLVEVIKAAGIKDDAIFFRKPLVLPGYYRAQKKWDIVVAKNRRLLAAIELKSQSGSFGKNLNNRAEEALGLAKDFWTAYREQAFGLNPQPWLGYVFLLEDSADSRKRVELKSGPFQPFGIFKNKSVIDRYRIMCERLVLERDYCSTALIVSPSNVNGGKFETPNVKLSVYKLAKSLHAHLSRQV